MTSPASWSPLASPEAVRAVAASGRYVFAALDDGRVLRSRDGGEVWTPAVAGPIGGTTTLLPFRDGLLAGTSAGVVRIDRPGGGPPAAGVPAGVVVTALTAQRGTAIAGTSRTGVFRSADGGVHWQAAGRGLPLDGVWLRVYAAASSAHGLVVAHGLGVSRSDDGGASWSSAGVGLPLQVPRATLAADGVVLYAGVAGRLYRADAPRRASDVLLWTEVHDGPGLGRPLDLLAATPGRLYAATPGPPYLVASTDGGASWEAVADGLPAPPWSLAAASSWLLALLPDGRLWRLRRQAPKGQARAPILDLRVHVASATVAFELRVPASVLLTIHDLLGDEVVSTTHGWFAAGTHRAALPPDLSPGLYRCRLRAGDTTQAVPFALLG